MNKSGANIVSAQVVLTPAGGRRPGPDVRITADNIGLFLPDPAEAERVKSYFESSGFDTGPLAANSFSITADRAVFELVFGTRLMRDEKAGIMCMGEDGGPGYELPLTKLPSDVSVHIVAVTFTPPPEFGPVSFG